MLPGKEDRFTSAVLLRQVDMSISISDGGPLAPHRMEYLYNQRLSGDSIRQVLSEWLLADAISSYYLLPHAQPFHPTGAAGS